MFSFVTLTLLFIFNFAEARPEYALRTGFVSCTACHHSPVGGGIRNQTGKLFGSHGFVASSVSQKHQWFQLDFRSEAIETKSATTRRGLMIMTVTPSIAIPINIDDSESYDPGDTWKGMNFVASYGLGLLDLGLGEAYVVKQLGTSDTLRFFDGIIFGRFLPPFGLMTDEHRTFTRLATQSTNRDYQSGLMISGTPSYSLHWDLALTSGLQGNTPAANDAPWAAFLNIRAIPYQGPFLIGASFSKHGSVNYAIKPEALSIYSLIDFKKISNYLPMTLTSEFVSAVGWNNSAINNGSTGGIGYFIPSSEAAWQTSITDSRSQSYLIQSQIQLTDHVFGLGRAEQFIPDVNFAGDKFNRAGGGLKWQINGQSSLQIRYDYGKSTRPGITELGSVRALGESFFLFYHLWL